MIRVALCTCPPDVGETLGRALVDARIAACVNISAPVRTVYRWKGTVEVEAEVTLTIKLPDENLDALRALLAQAHPYELPELLVLAVDEGASSPAYLAWVREATLGGG